jgi:hypothetical protein
VKNYSHISQTEENPTTIPLDCMKHLVVAYGVCPVSQVENCFPPEP